MKTGFSAAIGESDVRVINNNDITKSPWQTFIFPNESVFSAIAQSCESLAWFQVIDKCFHDDHHATKRAAMPMPMAMASNGP